MGKRKAKQIKIEEVQIENNIKSDRELTSTQKEDLDSMLNMIDKEVNNTEIIINKIESFKEDCKKSFENKEYNKRFIQACVLAVLAILMLIYSIYYIDVVKFNESYNNSICSETQTKINIFIDEESNTIYCDVDSTSVKSTDEVYIEINNLEWLKSGIDTVYNSYNIDGKEYKIDNKTRLKSLVLNEAYAYIEYANVNNNANKEVMLCSAKPLDVDLTGLSKKTLRFFEKSNPIMVKSYVNSFNNSFLMLSESIGGGELNIKTLEGEINKIENTMRTSQNKSSFIVEIKGIGILDLSKLSSVWSSPQVVYKESDSVVRIVNKETNNECLYIYSIYNNKMGLNPGDLLETELENVFIHKQFDDEDSNGFCTFVILSDNNIYCFKAINRDLVIEVLGQLGIDYSKLTIDKIQSVIKTQ